MKKKILAMLLAVTVMSGLMIGCGNAGTSEKVQDSTNEADIAEKSAEAEAEIKENITTPTTDSQSGEESESEPIEESPETESQTPEEWFESLKLTEPTLAIWNDVTGTKMLLVEGQSYTMADDDKLLLYFGNSLEHMMLTPHEFIGDIIVNNEYWEIPLKFVGEKTFNFTETINGTDYEQNVTLTIESKLDEIKEENLDASGLEWIDSLKEQITEPTAFIYNDTTGTKIIIEEGQDYTLSNGDIIGYYLPKGNDFVGLYPVKIVKNFEFENGIHSFFLSPEKFLEKTECKARYKTNDEEKEITFTLIPPTE